MIANRRGVNHLLIFGLLAVGLCGCDEKLSSFNPFAKPVDEVHGIITPTARMRNLQELAKKAPETTDPGQRESICRDLAQQIKKEPDSIMRGEILRTMVAYGPGPTSDAVLKLAARDTDADVRVIVCNLWSKRSDAAAVEVLTSVFASDSDRDVRMAAAKALGHARDPAVGRALCSGLDDPDPAMRHVVLVALHESTGKDYGTDPGDKESIACWKKYLKTGAEPPPQSWAQRLLPWYH